MRAIRITDTERLTNEELKELSAEILIQRKLRSPYIAEVAFYMKLRFKRSLGTELSGSRMVGENGDRVLCLWIMLRYNKVEFNSHWFTLCIFAQISEF